MVGNDRVHLQRRACRTDRIARLGILRRDYEVCAFVGLVVDFATADADPPRAYLGLFPFSFFASLRSAEVAGAEGAASC